MKNLKRWQIIGIVVGILFVVCLIGSIVDPIKEPKAPVASAAGTPAQAAPVDAPAPPDAKTIKRQEELKRLEPGQPKRKELIEQLMANGTIEKCRVDNGVGTLIVRNEFITSDFETKKALADMAFAWCRCSQLKGGGDCEVMIIQDSTNHHKIGKYGQSTGFAMD